MDDAGCYIIPIAICLVVTMFIVAILDFCGAIDDEDYYESGHRSMLYHQNPYCAAEEIGFSKEEMRTEEGHRKAMASIEETKGEWIDKYSKFQSPCKNCCPSLIQKAIAFWIGILIVVSYGGVIYLLEQKFDFDVESWIGLVLFGIVVWAGGMYLGASFIAFNSDSYVIGELLSPLFGGMCSSVFVVGFIMFVAEKK